MHVDLARQHQQQAGAERQGHREEHPDQGVRGQAGTVAQVVEQDAEQQAVAEQAAVGPGVGLAEQDADGHAGERGVADRLGEEGEALDHHQGAEAAEHRADQQAGEERVDDEAVGQGLWQVAGGGPGLTAWRSCS